KRYRARDWQVGTQGGRRFAEKDPARLKQKQADEADRLLTFSGVSERLIDVEQKQLENVIKDMTAKQTQLEEQLREANGRLHNSRTDVAFLAMLDKLRTYDTWIRTAREMAIPVVCLLLLVVTLSTLIAAVM